MEYQALHAPLWNQGTFWVTAAVLIFLFFFGRKIVGFVVDMLDKRSAEIAASLAEAAQLRAEAEKMLMEAEARRAEAEAQAKAMVEAASREAQRMAAEITQNAIAYTQRRERMALEHIAAAQAASVSAVQTAAAELVAKAAEIVMREQVDAGQDAKLIDAAISTLSTSFRRGAA